MDWQRFQARYMRDPWQTRLGNLGSTLGRIAQRLNATSPSAVADALREGMWMIEWNVHETPNNILIELAPMQSEPGLWWRSWGTVAASPQLRRLLAQRAP
ncbi:MAG TPA: hypothetical protein VFF59_12260 [Anaerolineae bacterium]|nr:hypothetical protein [Anaerolineae bacterium]